MNWQNWDLVTLTRRSLFGRGVGMLGTAALASLLPGQHHRRAACATLQTHFRPRAKRVISIIQAGGPAQMELYDYKPSLRRRQGQELPASVRGNWVRGEGLDDDSSHRFLSASNFAVSTSLAFARAAAISSRSGCPLTAC